MTIRDEKYSIVPYNSGYCPDCITRAEARETIVSHLRYEAFAIPSDDYYAVKTLVFYAQPIRC